MNTDFCAFASTSSFWNSPSNFRAVHQKSNSFFSDYLPHNLKRIDFWLILNLFQFLPSKRGIFTFKKQLFSVIIGKFFSFVVLCFQFFLSPKTALDILYAALGSAPLSQKRGFIRA